VFVKDASAFARCAIRLKSGICACWEYDRRKPVLSVTGNDTRRLGETRERFGADTKLHVDRATVSA